MVTIVLLQLPTYKSLAIDDGFALVFMLQLSFLQS